ncbi:Outer membrane protein OprM [Methylacidimicrobium cyclopophantes]|uniref:Outer membrane protein OprM n=1 Tax=Methylacidimicrobium cyclopophantes TaxID=1041766 RepID=A0A5E6MI06_9BACT|nr:efflux transporter outer membrane subunit [Methylacidimicrobium cyclopophantes]VVM07872.1 Outer membrane protein OprM [Methylacidimicrobium cyclopophantes]
MSVCRPLSSEASMILGSGLVAPLRSWIEANGTGEKEAERGRAIPRARARNCFPWLWTWVGALSVSLAGCAYLPKDSRPATPIAPPAMAATVSSVGPDAFSLSSEWPRNFWWRSLRCPELDRVLHLALTSNPDLRATRQRVHQAWAMAAGARSRYLPSVGVRPWLANSSMGVWGFPGSSFFGPFGTNSFFFADIIPLFGNYHVDLWGEDRARVRAAVGEARAEESEVAVTRLLLGATVARSYVRLAAAQEELLLARRRETVARELLSLSRVRGSHGVDSLFPVHTAEERLESARQDVAALERESQSLRNEIARLAGQGPDWGRTLVASEASFPRRFPLPERIAFDLLGHRPDVAVARWRAQAAAEQVKVAKTAFYPNLNLVAWLGFQTLNFPTLFLSPGLPLMYMAGPAITLPIFEGGRLTAQLESVAAEYSIAVERYNSVLLSAVQQVADALVSWQEAVQDLEAQERAVQAATANVELAQRLFASGLNVRQDLLEMQYRLAEEESRLSMRHAQHVDSAVGLLVALGGGFEPAAVSEWPRKEL